MSESFPVCSDDQTELKDFFDRLKQRFPGTDCLSILPILFMIDMKEWKFPEWIHQSPIHEIAEFIENDQTLKNCFLKYSKEEHQNAVDFKAF